MWRVIPDISPARRQRRQPGGRSRTPGPRSSPATTGGCSGHPGPARRQRRQTGGRSRTPGPRSSPATTGGCSGHPGPARRQRRQTGGCSRTSGPRSSPATNGRLIPDTRAPLVARSEPDGRHGTTPFDAGPRHPVGTPDLMSGAGHGWLRPPTSTARHLEDPRHLTSRNRPQHRRIYEMPAR